VIAPKRGSEQAVLGAKNEVDRTYSEPGQKAPVQFRVVEDHSPVRAVLAEARQADLTVIGVSEEWGLESQLFGWRPQRIAQDSPNSLLLVRKYGQAAPTPAAPIAPATTAPVPTNNPQQAATPSNAPVAS
jgi:hypothetical protein